MGWIGMLGGGVGLGGFGGGGGVGKGRVFMKRKCNIGTLVSVMIRAAHGDCHRKQVEGRGKSA